MRLLKIITNTTISFGLMLVTAKAALISWSAHNISPGNGTSDVSTEGKLVDARSGNNSKDVVVNGVTFLSSEKSGNLFDSLFNNDNISGRRGSCVTNSDRSNYSQFLEFGQRSGRPGSNKPPRIEPREEWATVNFSGLTVGHTYQIQIWASDTNMTPGDAGDNGLLLGDGSEGDPDINTGTMLLYEYADGPDDSTYGLAGQYGLGTFVADATTQSFNVRKYKNLLQDPSPYDQVHFSNGWQIRDLGVTGSREGAPVVEAKTGSERGDSFPKGTILLGGFDGTNAPKAPKQSPGLVGLDVELMTSGSEIQLQPPGQMKSNLWGSAGLEPKAFNTGDKQDKAVLRLHTRNPWTFSLKITNNSGTDIKLGRIHYLTKKDSSDGPVEQMITYTSGDLDDSPGSNTGMYAFPNGAENPFDIDLSAFLNDVTLEGNGEMAVFTWSHGKPVNPAGNSTVRIDNIAISGMLMDGGMNGNRRTVGSPGSDSDYKTWGAWQRWTFDSKGTAKGDDYDKDGLTNDVERIFGTDPTDATSANPYVSGFDESEGTFAYTRRDQSLTGLEYSVWYTTDNKEWSVDPGAVQSPGPLRNGVEKVTVRLSPELLAKPQLSVQIRAGR